MVIWYEIMKLHFLPEIYIFGVQFINHSESMLQQFRFVQSIYSPTSLIRPPFIRISLLSGRDLAKIFFFVCTIITGKRTTTLLIAKKECRVRCYNTLHVATCTPLGRQLHVLNIESPISGQIPYPDERRSRHGRIREVGLYMYILFKLTQVCTCTMYLKACGWLSLVHKASYDRWLRTNFLVSTTSGIRRNCRVKHLFLQSSYADLTMFVLPLSDEGFSFSGI